MIDHLLGRPSTRLKRLQVLLVLTFWAWVLRVGPRDGPNRVPFVRRLNDRLKRFSPWQLVVFSMTSVYALRHLNALAGFGAPEPLAHMYARPYYRVTWINTALEAGFASAMTIRPLWLRDIASVVFSLYYVIYANEADEKLRRYRAFCTIDFLRVTWHKTTNPYIRAVTWFHRPRLPVAEAILIPRPSLGPHAKRPIRAWLFYADSLRRLREEDELVIDFVGGGFVSMDPRHHEERLRQTAKELKRPVLAVDYCKAPEYPYPYALEECFDLYRTLHESKGTVLGMSGRPTFRTILTGDSAGGNLAAGVMLKILEYPQPHIKSAYASKAAGGPGSVPPPLPKPIALVLNYPALNFAYTSWMRPDHVSVLRSQSEVNLQNITPIRRGSVSRKRDSIDMESKNRRQSQQKRASRALLASNKSYTSLANQALGLDERVALAEADENSPPGGSPPEQQGKWIGRIESDDVEAQMAAANSEDEDTARRARLQKELQAATDKMDIELNERQSKSTAVNTRLMMTSMSAYFQDRIMTQSMMRAMAILYIGPRRQPDFDNDYFLSPIVAPAKYLADFPPVLFTCGEKDPICDDTVVMAGRIRQAKLARQMEVKKRGARFGEQLRMSGATAIEEDEDAEDWVQMRIIEGWSHGYLQMSSLLPEAKRVISFLSNWMGAAFDDYSDRVLAPEQAKIAAQTASAQTKMQEASMPSPRRKETSLLSSPKPKLRPVLGAHQPHSSSDEDEDEPLTFTPKVRRSSSQQSAGSDVAPPALPGSPAGRLLPSVAKLQNSSRRPSSFSDHEQRRVERRSPTLGATSTQAGNGSASSLLPPPAVPARRRRSFDNGMQTDGSDSNLVKASSLMERRRMDTVKYMGGGAAEDASKAQDLPITPTTAQSGYGGSALESSDDSD
jgi:acetyl esterase/lipase